MEPLAGAQEQMTGCGPCSDLSAPPGLPPPLGCRDTFPPAARGQGPCQEPARPWGCPGELLGQLHTLLVDAQPPQIWYWADLAPVPTHGLCGS